MAPVTIHAIPLASGNEDKQLAGRNRARPRSLSLGDAMQLTRALCCFKEYMKRGNMDINNIKIRETNNSDIKDIIDVETIAFGYKKEAELTVKLLNDKSALPLVSLLAYNGSEAIGHILFTKAVIENYFNSPLIHILAPLAVKPEFQNKGIGGLLIKEGIKILKEIGTEIIFVLGHKSYYPKYGFIPNAIKLGFKAPYSIPFKDEDAWMVQFLKTNKNQNVKGKIKCADELNKPEHWKE